MAKIPDYIQKAFAGGIPPTDVLAIFGALRAGYTPSTSYSSNIETLQSLDAWENGFETAMINNYNPALQDLNTAFHVPSRQIAYCSQAGIPEWKDNISYEIGSVVSDGLGSIYKSLIASNLNGLFTDATKWFMVESLTIRDVVANYTAINTDFYIRWNGADTNSDDSLRRILLPNATASLMGRRYFIKNVSGVSYPIRVYHVNTAIEFNAHSGMTCVNISASTLNGPTAVEFVCDGEIWWCITNLDGAS